MNYIVPVFLGSKGDMPFVSKFFDELYSFGIEHSTEIISGEKATEECLARVDKYDERGVTHGIRPIYNAIVGMGNTMGPVINGNTANPVITTPKGSKDELRLDMWSSLRRPRDSPLITVFGDGEATALYIAEIIGLDSGHEDVRKKVCEKKGIKYVGGVSPFISIIYDDNAESAGIVKDICSKITELGVAAKGYKISDAKKFISWDYPVGSAILVSKLTDRNVRTFAGDADFPLIVTPSYKETDIPTLQEDVEGFLGMSMNSVLPVGIVLSPKNAALAALRIDGLRNDYVHGEIMKYGGKLRATYSK